MYRNLTKTTAQIEAAGLTETVNRIIDTASAPVIIAHDLTLEFVEEKQAKRAMRLMYEFLYFHPVQKSRLSIRQEGKNLRICLRDKEERRGRKGMKEAT